MEEINRRYAEDAAATRSKREKEEALRIENNQRVLGNTPDIEDATEPITLHPDYIVPPPIDELPEERTLSLKDIKKIEAASMRARKERLARTLHTHPKYPEPKLDRTNIRRPLFSEKVSRRFAIAGATTTALTIIAGSSWTLNEILKRDYPKPVEKPAAPASPVAVENQTVAHKIDAATTKAEQGILTQEERVNLAKQWFKEGEDLSRTVRENGDKGYFALMHHTTLGARVAQLREGGNVFQHITGEGFSLVLPGNPEYKMINTDHLIRGSAMVRLGVMSMDQNIKPDTDLEGHVPPIFIPQIHALGDLAKFDGRVDHIYDSKHKFNEYPYLYRQLAAMHKAGKEYPKELLLSNYTAIDVAEKRAFLDPAHPTFAVPVYTGPANPDWVNDFSKAAYIDPALQRAHRRGIDFTDPNRPADYRFMNDLNAFFHDGQNMRRSLLGMLESREFAYAGQRFSELYTILKQGLGSEFTYHGQQKLFDEIYAPGMVVAIEDAFTDHRNQEVRLFPAPSYEVPNKFEVRLPNKSLVVLTGEPVFLRDASALSLRAVNQWPVRTGRGRFVQYPDGSIKEDAAVKEYKGYWQEDWLGKIIQKP